MLLSSAFLLRVRLGGAIAPNASAHRAPWQYLGEMGRPVRTRACLLGSHLVKLGVRCKAREGAGAGENKFVYPKWASQFWLPIQNFSVSLEEHFCGFEWVCWSWPGRDGAYPRRNSGLLHGCTSGSQYKAQKEIWLVSGL